VHAPAVAAAPMVLRAVAAQITSWAALHEAAGAALASRVVRVQKTKSGNKLHFNYSFEDIRCLSEVVDIV